MKILKKQIKQGIMLVSVESLDDLWYLSHVVEPGDTCKSRTERKIKIGGEDDRKQRVVKKQVFLSIKVEKVEFHKHSNILRISGEVVSGPEDISRGSHHTLSIEEGTTLEINKQQWLKYQIEKLEEAAADTGTKILIVCHDREEAFFGMLTRQGMELISALKGNVSKKGFDEGFKSNFYKEIIAALAEYNKQHSPGNLILASPGFWKEYVYRELPEDLKKKIVQATCSYVGDRGLQEIVKRPELKQVLEKDKTRKEALLVDEVMAAVSKDEACYGMEDCSEKVSSGAVKKLLVSDNFIVKAREENKYYKLDSLMKKTESMDGEIHIISSEEAASKLDSLGGIAGVLRWKV